MSKSECSGRHGPSMPCDCAPASVPPSAVDEELTMTAVDEKIVEVWRNSLDRDFVDRIIATYAALQRVTEEVVSVSGELGSMTAERDGLSEHLRLADLSRAALVAERDALKAESKLALSLQVAQLRAENDALRATIEGWQTVALKGE